MDWVVDHLCDAWRAGAGGDARWQLDSAAQPHEAHHLKLDCSKARMRLGWGPRWPLVEAIRRIVA